MAEEQENNEVETEESGSRTKRWIVIGIILLGFLAAEITLAVFFVNKLTPEDPAMKAMKENKDAESRKQMQLTSMGLTLEEPISVTVNIAGTNGERFLKASVQFEYQSESGNDMLGALLNERMPKIRNLVIEVLSSRPLAELLTIEGKKKIREEIVANVNQIIPETQDETPVGKVTRCFFDEFVIQ